MTSAAALQSDDSVRLMVSLPADLLGQYATFAELSKESLDAVLGKALQLALQWRDAAYMVDRAADKEIRRLLGGRVDSAGKLIEMIGRLKAVNIGGRRVELSVAVQEQIYWALRSMEKEGVEGAAEQLIAQAVAEKYRV